MDEHTYESFKEIREMSNAQKRGEEDKVAEYMNDIINRARRNEL